jgi:hypothetical protein
VVGALVAAGGASRPAAWTSTDGRSWTSVPIAAETYYGQLAVLYAAGCRDGQLAAVGAQNGGAHGNPRVTQWRLRPDGSLQEVKAAFELYGGPDAVAVDRITGGPEGWLITGGRVAGAAVWVSADATGFRLVDHAPQLASDAQVATEALDAAPYKKEWVVVGGGRRGGRINDDPMAWRSADGLTWTRMVIPSAGEEHQALQRVVPYGDGMVAAGVIGAHFAAWTFQNGQWASHRSKEKATEVTGLSAAGGKLWATVTDGSAYQLMVSDDGGRGWRRTRAPVELAAAGADRAMTLTTAGNDVLLVVDDGRRGRAWLAPAAMAAGGG